MSEGQPLVSFTAPIPRHGENSTWSTIVIIVCAMAGVGILGLPNGLAQSGWLGLVIMMVCVLCSMYTGALIGDCIRECDTFKLPVKDYPDIGWHAFGRPGRLIAQLSVYTTLFGVSIIFLILLGILMSSIVPEVSRGFWTLSAGLFIVLPLALSLKTLAEVKWLSYLGMAATIAVVIISVASPISFRFGPHYAEDSKANDFDTEVVHRAINPGVVGAFSIFTFAFGATALFPNVYLSMEHTHKWAWAVSLGYIIVLLIVLPVTITGYAVYGKYLLSSGVQTILDAILNFDSRFGSVILKIAIGIMVIHILSTLPLIMNPVFRFLELKVLAPTDGVEPRVAVRIFERCTVVALAILLSLFFPFFLSIMGLISCISVSLSGYVLPCLFYWKIYKPESRREMVQLVFVIAFGVIGSAVGIYVNGTQLVDQVHDAWKSGQNPFKGLFRFDF